MKIVTHLTWVSLALALVPYAYGQVMPANTAEAKKAAAQLSEPTGPPQPTLDKPTDRTTVPGERGISIDGMQRDSGNSRNAPNGRRGEIGVWLTANGGQGVRVGQVAAGGAADKAGLRNGDIILQVNGNSVASPTATAQQIRAVPVGQIATLTVLRDGAENQMEVTLTAARAGQSYQVGYGGENGAGASDRAAMNSDSSGLAARTSRLEQQVESMTEELRQMRQQLSSMRASGSSASGSSTDSGVGVGPTPSAASPAPSSAPPAQSGSGSAAPSSSATPISTPTSSTSPAAGGPSTPSAAPAVGSSGSTDTQDLFGGTPSSSSSSPSGGTSK